jgi:two-component system CitB family response regulator/CitB family two-component system response regulator MalR
MTNVLIVEDDPMVAMINKKYVNSFEGFSVVGCVSKRGEFFDLISNGKIDLIIMDVYMPGRTGLELLKEMREVGYTIDVIMVTAANSVEEVKNAFAYGVVDYLVKPFEFERLKEALEKYEARAVVFAEKDSFQQSEIDKLHSSQSIEEELPKGIQNKTLNKIIKLMEDEDKIWTIKDLSERLMISGVTIKKYMDYLEKSEKIRATIFHRQRGRPEYRYKLIG